MPMHERVDDPTPEEAQEFIEWSVTNEEDVEVLDFEFADRGTTAPHLQLAGQHYNVTGLDGDRLDAAREILRPVAVDEADLEAEADAMAPYLTVATNADVEEHIRIVERLLEGVYSSGWQFLEALERSEAPENDAEPETIQATCHSCGMTYGLELVMESEPLGVEYYGVAGNVGSLSDGDTAVDVLHDTTSEKWTCAECGDFGDS